MRRRAVATPSDIFYSVTQKENYEKIQNQIDEIHKQPKLVETKQNLKENKENPDNTQTTQTQMLICDANTMVGGTVMPEEDTKLIDLSEDVTSPIIEGRITERQAKCDIISVGNGQQTTENSRKSSDEDCN